MVIELSGVQFWLSSEFFSSNYFQIGQHVVLLHIQIIRVIFPNQTSAQREFDLKSQVWFRTKIARPEVQLPLYYIHFEITQFNSLNTRTTKTTKSCQICQTMAVLSFIFLQCDWLVFKNFEILLVCLFYCLILIGGEKDAI